MSDPRTAPAPRPASGRPRAPYRAPRLERHGDLRGLTLGFTGGINDSGGVPLERPTPFYGGYMDIP
jgi:hypothetical protein